MALNQPCIFAAIKRHVLAFDADTGEQIWKTKLPGWYGSYTTLVVDAGVLYVARHGKLHALDPDRGDILWTAEDKDLKHAPIMLGTSSGAVSGGQLAQHQQVMHNAVASGAAGGAGVS